MSRVTVVLVALAMVAGCVGADPASEAEHRFGGVFQESATQADVEDFGDRMQAHGGDASILESFPMQFGVRGFGRSACLAAEAEAGTLPYVASVTGCRAVVEPSDGDGPTSSA